MNVLNKSAKSSPLKSTATVDDHPSGHHRRSHHRNQHNHNNSHLNNSRNQSTHQSLSFNGIFAANDDDNDTNHSIGPSLDSTPVDSPVVSSPMVAANHRLSPTTTTTATIGQHVAAVDDEQHLSSSSAMASHRKGRKRKAREELDSLQDKLDIRRRIQKSCTTEELVQKFNIDVNLEETIVTNNRLSGVSSTSTVRPNRKPTTTTDHNQPESKSEIMHRFFSSQAESSTTASPAVSDDLNDEYLNTDYNPSPPVLISTTSANQSQCLTHTAGHYPSSSAPITSTTAAANDCDAYPSQSSAITSSNHQKCVTNNTVDREIDQIMSVLPPIDVNIDLSDCVSVNNDNNNTSDSDFISVDNKDHNHDRDDDFDDRPVGDQNHSDLDIQTNNDNSNDSNLIESNSRLKVVPEYEVDRYCEHRWEYVNGTYNADTRWRPWNRMTSAVSFNGDILHILPYVDVDDGVGGGDGDDDDGDEHNDDVIDGNDNDIVVNSDAEPNADIDIDDHNSE